MLRIHLVGVAEWIVWSVDDHFRVIVRIGTAVSSDDGAAAIARRWERKLGAGHAMRCHAHPSFVAQYRAVLADKDGVGQSVSDVLRTQSRITIERTVDFGLER